MASLVLLGAGFGIGYASGSSPASPASPSEAAGPGDTVAPVVVAPQGLHTPAGFAALLAATRARFGTTMVAEATVHPDYAVITMPAPGAPARAQTFLYRGDFDDPSNGGTPGVSAYASNEFRESGYVQAGPDGTVLAVHPYGPG